MQNNINLTTEEAQQIVTLLTTYRPGQYLTLIDHINNAYQDRTLTIEGLPSKELIEQNEFVIFLSPDPKHRTEYIAYSPNDAGYDFAIFISLGEDAGSDDDSEIEGTYEELVEWAKENL